MSVRSVLNNYNYGFLIFGIGCINYGKRDLKSKWMFNLIRFLLICNSLYIAYDYNLWVMAVLNLFKWFYIVIQL